MFSDPVFQEAFSHAYRVRHESSLRDMREDCAKGRTCTNDCGTCPPKTDFIEPDIPQQHEYNNICRNCLAGVLTTNNVNPPTCEQCREYPVTDMWTEYLFRRDSD
mgnify:CR=1 FL=1